MGGAEEVEMAYRDGNRKRIELLKTDAFMLRGLSGVQAENSRLATGFNLARMITILGVKGLTEQLRMISWAA
jgi:hypothetical protein